MKVIVVGAGIMGLSSAWGLAKRGHTVEVYEQGPIPNPLGSSVDQHRTIRQPYGDEDGYAILVADAYAAWEELWGDLGEALYFETGSLALDTGASRWARLSAEALKRQGIPFTRLSGREVAARWPVLAGDQVTYALYLEKGGPLFAGRIVEALAHHVARRGAKLHPHARVRDIDPDRAQVTLASGTTQTADTLIVAAGPWVSRLVPGMAKRITPSRQVVVYVAPPDDQAAVWAGMPVIMDKGVDRGGFYLIPPVGGTGMKVGDRSRSLTGDPDTDRDPSEAEARRVFAACSHRLREFTRYRIDHAKTCFYSIEKDDRFIIQPIGKAGWIMTGFSGHGFKFGALLGRSIAETLDGARSADSMTAIAAGNHPVAA